MKQWERRMWANHARGRREGPGYVWSEPDEDGARLCLSASGRCYRVRPVEYEGTTEMIARDGECSCPEWRRNARNAGLDRIMGSCACKHLCALHHLPYAERNVFAQPAVELPSPAPAEPDGPDWTDAWWQQEKRDWELIARAGSVAAALAYGVLS